MTMNSKVRVIPSATKMRFVKDIFTRTYKRHFEKGVSFSKCLLLKRGFVICASSPLTVHVLLLLVVGIPKANFKALPSKFFPVAAECFHDMPVLAGTPKLFRHSNQATATPALVKKIGRTTYIVRVHFSKTSKETMSDKIKRMLKNEIQQM